jgi:hypothetical protein
MNCPHVAPGFIACMACIDAAAALRANCPRSGAIGKHALGVRHDCIDCREHKAIAVDEHAAAVDERARELDWKARELVHALANCKHEKQTRFSKWCVACGTSFEDGPADVPTLLVEAKALDREMRTGVTTGTGARRDSSEKKPS